MPKTNTPSIVSTFEPEVLERWLEMRRFWDDLRPGWEHFLKAEAAKEKAWNALAKCRASLPKDKTEDARKHLEQKRARVEAGREALSTAERDLKNLPTGTPPEVRKGYANRVQEAKQRLEECCTECQCAEAAEQEARAAIEEPKKKEAELAAVHKQAQAEFDAAFDALPRPAPSVGRSLRALTTVVLGRLKADIQAYIECFFLDEPAGIMNQIARFPLMQRLNHRLGTVIDDIEGTYYTPGDEKPKLEQYRRWILVIETMTDENPNLVKALFNVDLPFGQPKA